MVASYRPIICNVTADEAQSLLQCGETLARCAFEVGVSDSRWVSSRQQAVGCILARCGSTGL